MSLDGLRIQAENHKCLKLPDYRALWLKATKSEHQIKRIHGIICSSSPALPSYLHLTFSAFCFSVFWGEGVPRDTEDPLLRGAPQHAAGKCVFSFQNVKTLTAVLGVSDGINGPRDFTQTLFISCFRTPAASPNESKENVFPPTFSSSVTHLSPFCLNQAIAL